jgi:hypothetical protein
MKSVRVSIVGAALLLTACASQIDGTFEPACIAYEGDRITLADGRYEWQRFTDQVEVDESGERIDPFPGYPISGTYVQVKDQISLVPDGSTAKAERYLLEHRDELYLLTYDENEAVLDGEEMPGCALRRASEK